MASTLPLVVEAHVNATTLFPTDSNLGYDYRMGVYAPRTQFSLLVRRPKGCLFYLLGCACWCENAQPPKDRSVNAATPVVLEIYGATQTYLSIVLLLF